MALLLAGCVFWRSTRFAAKAGELEMSHGFFVDVVSVCRVIHGVGFRLRYGHWQGFFVRSSPIWYCLAGLIFFLSLKIIA
ncbi:cyd operon YbgE family protein [Shigella flexneri]